jgi:hypothetical protein
MPDFYNALPARHPNHLTPGAAIPLSPYTYSSKPTPGAFVRPQS